MDPEQPNARIRDRMRAIIPKGLVRAGSWGLVDQSVISGANFITMIVAARVLGPSAFGIFALMFTVLVFMETVQRSLITTPHNVLGVNKSGDLYRTYTSSAAGLQVGLGLLFALCALVIGSVIQFFDGNLGFMVMLLAPAAFAWQCHEFTRRVLYTEFRIPAAVTVDVCTYFTRLAVLAVLVMWIGLDGPRLLMMYAGTWLVGALVGLWQIRGSLRRAFDPGVIAEHWSFGRWLFASNVVSHLPRYASAAVLSSALSVAAYGGYRAFEQLSNGSNVPLTAMSNVLRPRMAKEAERGPRVVWQTMVPVMVLGGAALTVFAAALIVFRDTLISTIYGPEYTEFAAALFLIALFPPVILQKSMLIKAMQAFRNTRAIFYATVVSSISGSALGAAAIVAFGLPAAGSIMVLSGLIAVGWLGWVWKRHLSDEEKWQRDLNRAPEPSIHG
jgi:O-antigen/teichoic acid export membrane protein